ncbi:hypothetical protein WA026_019027 [Henosepilachna vigintioctopunctata]|uniref:MYND-type domain-containing protein n=1 Tax=Henosepilachna vigintioctopunctata TaxID=420089 RepID=A0AAW1VC03_9CUCU
MDSILLPTEIEFYIDTMKPQEMRNLGSRQWLEWHQRLQKLNQEALIEASAMKEEYVKEILISFGKVNILIHEAILINIWKHKVLPQLMKLEPYPEKLVSFHPSSCEAMEDAALDLLDYSTGMVSQLLSVKYQEMTSKESATQELVRQKDNLIFDIGIKSLSIIRYIAESMERLPLSICSNIYGQYDIPILLIELLRSKPWVKNDQQYAFGKWKDWDGEVVCHPEAQIWLTLRFILLDQACPQYYPITDNKRIQLLSLLSFLTPIILDQLSPLIELKQWLSQMTVMQQPSAPPRPILLENCLVIKENILSQAGGKWKEIAKEQIAVIFNGRKDYLVETAKILNEAYNTDLLEKFDVKGSVSCARCGKDSIQRCSRCKKAWYCSRKCQVMHWQQHKEICIQA